MTSSNIADIFKAKGRVVHVTLDTIRNGEVFKIIEDTQTQNVFTMGECGVAEHDADVCIEGKLNVCERNEGASFIDNNKRIYIVDSETNEDIESFVEQVFNDRGKYLFAGSLGIMDTLVKKYRGDKPGLPEPADEPARGRPGKPKRQIGITSSMYSALERQLSRAEESGVFEKVIYDVGEETPYIPGDKDVFVVKKGRTLCLWCQRNIAI